MDLSEQLLIGLSANHHTLATLIADCMNYTTMVLLFCFPIAVIIILFACSVAVVCLVWLFPPLEIVCCICISPDFVELLIDRVPSLYHPSCPTPLEH